MPHLRRNTLPQEMNEIHMSFGFVVLAVIAVRLVFRIKDGAPADEPSLPGWQRTASHLLHWALYGLIIIFILTGWTFVSARGWPITFFGLFPIPPLVPAGWPPGRAIGEIHGLLVWPVLALIGAHVAAALWHHFIARDNVLLRMLPGQLKRR